MKPWFPALQVDSLPAEPQERPKNTELGSLSLLQWIFLTQESNQGLLHYRQILYQLSYQGSPSIWGGLHIAKERREVKIKGKRERYIQLNADFQRTAWRDKKAFFNEQCIKLEEKKGRGKTRDLFRKMGDIKGTFYLKMHTIKDINCRDLVDAEEIKKRWKEYMEELYQRTVQKRS